MKTLTLLGSTMSCLLFSAALSASPLSMWASDGWTQFADDEGMAEGPGVGGQAFDTEYLYYKQLGNILYLGLQTGFDVIDGHQTYGSKSYYGGDLALSFDGATIGDETTYEYGIDFGLYTEGYTNGNRIDMGAPIAIAPGQDAAGMYAVSSWSNNVYSGHHISDPFAIDAGSLHTALLSNNAGSEGNSYYRTVSFDMSGLGSVIDVHWTMSCGNDNINGSFTTVPEPPVLSLLGLSVLGLGFMRKVKNQS